MKPARLRQRQLLCQSRFRGCDYARPKRLYRGSQSNKVCSRGAVYYSNTEGWASCRGRLTIVSGPTKRQPRNHQPQQCFWNFSWRRVRVSAEAAVVSRYLHKENIVLSIFHICCPILYIRVAKNTILLLFYHASTQPGAYVSSEANWRSFNPALSRLNMPVLYIFFVPSSYT